MELVKTNIGRMTLRGLIAVITLAYVCLTFGWNNWRAVPGSKKTNSLFYVRLMCCEVYVHRTAKKTAMLKPWRSHVAKYPHALFTAEITDALWVSWFQDGVNRKMWRSHFSFQWEVHKDACRCSRLDVLISITQRWNDLVWLPDEIYWTWAVMTGVRVSVNW